MLTRSRLPRLISFLFALLLCATSVILHAATYEPNIVPTVNPTLAPTSAIQVPLHLAADNTSVWRLDLEQRLLLTGRVNISIGYRLLRADDAAVWLTPSRESGERTFDVAIYLSGNVEVREGDSSTPPPPSARNSWSPPASSRTSSSPAPPSARPRKTPPSSSAATNSARNSSPAASPPSTSPRRHHSPSNRPCSPAGSPAAPTTASSPAPAKPRSSAMNTATSSPAPPHAASRPRQTPAHARHYRR